MEFIQVSRALVISLTISVFLVISAWAQAKHTRNLVYPPLPEVKIPQPTRVVLKNGMVVFLMENHELPLVEVSAKIRTGTRLEPIDKVGLAGLTGRVLRSGGTTTRSGNALNDYLEGKAASIETSIGQSSGSAVMSCLAEDFPEILKVFNNVLRHPAFDQEKLSIAKNQAIAGIARQNDNPDAIISREYRKLIYGNNSPYAWRETYATVKAITREDLVAWHEKYFHPNRIILGLVGDFQSDKALDLVKEVFGSWKPGPTLSDTEVSYQAGGAGGVFYVEKNDMTQSKIIIGHLGLMRTHPDYYPVVVMNQILSGSFGARLFSNIRSKKGLAYDVHGAVGFGWDYPGLASLSMSTKTTSTGPAIDALIQEAYKIIESEPPTTEEVKKAKAGILNSFVFSVDAPGKVLGKVLTYEYYGYPLDWLNRFRKGIDQVTMKQVQKAARNHLQPKQFTILVVGPREGTKPALARFESVKELDISIPNS